VTECCNSLHASADVTKEWRRDLNRRYIQPQTQDADDNSGKQGHQSIYRTAKKQHISRLLSEAVLLAFIIAIPLSVHAGFFDRFFTKATAEVVANESAISYSVFDIPLLTALQNPNPMGARGGAEILVNEYALVSTGPVGEAEIAEQKNSLGEIRVYTVREGDSLSQIAEMFGVTTNTIMWANDISKASSIRPGDTLVILPIAGVRHVVKSGDTIASIAKKYEGDVDEILSYNQLVSASDIDAGDTLIIPGGAVQMAPVNVASVQPVRVSGAASVAATGFSHPAPGAIRTQGIHGYNAVDLAAGSGSPIRAAASGEVIVSKASGWNGGYGQYIVIRHPSGAQTLYSHLMRNDVRVGEYVSQGQVIGGMGSTGRSTGTHLHFEVRGATNPF